MSEDREQNEGHVEHVERASDEDVEGHKLADANSEGHVEHTEGHVERASDEDVEGHVLTPHTEA